MSKVKTYTSVGPHPRTFKDDHFIAAGYHLQEWGPIPSPDHELIGTYQTPTGETITVSYVPDGVSGHPEFELAWNVTEDGHGPKVTVLDEDTALQYLILDGAITVEP